jgi:sugar lactone lactonase YvrE
MRKEYFSLPSIGLLAVIAVAGLAACSDFVHASSVPSLYLNTAPAGTLRHGTNLGSLYISSESPEPTNGIAVYSGSPLKYTNSITKGLGEPYGIALNSRGQLFVANHGSSTVSVYNAKSGKLIRTLSNRFMKVPLSLAVAPNDDVYVLSRSYVNIFKKGLQSGTKRIDVNPLAIAIDASGNAYIATANAVEIFAPGGTKPISSISQGVDVPDAMAIDSGGNLYVSNSPNSGCGNITVYDSATGSLESTITKGVCHPGGIAFDSQSNAYVTDIAPPSVNVFSATTHKRINLISKGLSEPFAILFDPTGNLYVANLSDPGNVVVFPPGKKKPSQTLTDGVDFPYGLAWLP